MSEIDKSIQELKLVFKIGNKNAEKLFSELVKNPNLIDEISNKLKEIKNKYSNCKICFYLTINNVCQICEDPTRDNSKICVVNNVFDAMNINKLKIYNGLFHILNGEIDLNKNITPDKIKINELFSRINNNSKEVIIATSATFSGEITSQYIKNMLHNKNIKISRLARGIPQGGSLEYIDDTTLKSALKNRN
ncbi:recombination mediator RecR [Spiroplasma endosymbiont of Amphibalanus improvisus]|uniref:recombination mediator RecR n=1 Tax=Spiroplasma endosymbiont of Amphibalanus improvisus TaxID=3066327 RepID=UPI00313A8B58